MTLEIFSILIGKFTHQHFLRIYYALDTSLNAFDVFFHLILTKVVSEVGLGDIK